MRELFLYSAGSGSHPPSSSAPRATPRANLRSQKAVWCERLETASKKSSGVFRTRHLLTDAGQVFFETREALVPSDTNGQLDVYEYEGGHVHLISSGTSSFESNLEDVSESGDDVFFRSNQQLVPQDNQEGQIVIYDARVAGGFAEPSSPPPCTTADACRTAVSPQPSIYGAPASQTFSGVGNLARPRRSQAEGEAQGEAREVQEGLCQEEEGKCVGKRRRRRPRSPPTPTGGVSDSAPGESQQHSRSRSL